MIVYPEKLRFRGNDYYFQMVAPITKDGIYQAVDARTQVVKHALWIVPQKSKEW